MLNSSIWPIDKTLSGATTPGQSGTRSDGNEDVLCIPQSSSITGATSSDCLMSYVGHSLEESIENQSVYSEAPADCVTLRDSYPSTEMQSVYSAAPTDSTNRQVKKIMIMKLS